MIEDEDDDSPDFNFILPKKLLPESQSTIFKRDSDTKTENKVNNNAAGKYKLWKYDYFRQKDSEAMDNITSQLKKHRFKQKSSLSKSIVKSSNKPVLKLANKSVTKPHSKVMSKPQSGVSRSKHKR
mmetsp:Transcript_29320/g.25921  ORF Transcript_29320/g.25921 Transcript_29320/m.25921 type:complete len:126 (+) Transcript_29320:72-449(+)